MKLPVKTAPGYEIPEPFSGRSNEFLQIWNYLFSTSAIFMARTFSGSPNSVINPLAS